MVNRWLKQLREAADLARNSIADKRKSYIGAVIAERNKIIGSGVNSNDPHPAMQKHYPWYSGVHAEAAALIDATRERGDVRGCDLFVTRVYRTGEIASTSKPCKYCMALIALFGIRRVFYVDDGEICVAIVNGGRGVEEFGSADLIAEKPKKQG